MTRRVALVLVFTACTATRPVTRRDGTASLADKSLAAVEHGLLPLVSTTGPSGRRATLSERMSYYNVPGVSIAVVREDRIVWAKGFGVLREGNPAPVTPHALFEAASVSKPITDVVAMLLTQKGALDLDTPVDHYLRQWRLPPTPFSERPTPRLIMEHRAGFNVDSVPGYAEGGPVPTMLQSLSGLAPAKTPPVKVTTLPGADFSYSAGGLTVLAQALEEISHEPLEQLAQRLLFGPLGMSDSTLLQPPPPQLRSRVASGHYWNGRPLEHPLVYPEKSAAGLRTTPTDLAKVMIEIDRALAGHGALLTEHNARSMLTPRGGNPVGLGFFVKGEGASRRISHDGWNYGFTCRMVGYPARHEGAVVMTNGDTGLLMVEILDAIGEAYGWPGSPRPRKEAIMSDSGAVQPYVGRYAWDAGMEAEVLRQGQRLFVHVSHVGGGDMDPFPPAELFATSPTRFFAVAPQISAEFERDAGGRVIALIHDEGQGPTRSARIGNEPATP